MASAGKNFARAAESVTLYTVSVMVTELK